MVTFTRVPEVQPGDPITSAHYRAMARACNDRLRSGVGDGHWRIAWYWLQAFRQIRNSDGAFVFPPNAEFFEVYQHIRAQDAEWPVAAPGDPEGINVASVGGEFAFGSEGRDLHSEADRLTDPAAGGLFLDSVSTAEDQWLLAKLQRGGYDPRTGALAAPAFRAAREHLRIVNGPTSVHGNAYGGFLPTPTYLGECTTLAPGADPEYLPNWEIKFTPTAVGTAAGKTLLTFGTCPENGADVAWIYYLPDRYVVVTYGGTVYDLLKVHYVEGPYDGGNRLRKTWGAHLPRILNAYVAQFRGTEGQRLDGTGAPRPRDWNRWAFDTQRCLTSQYRLAPAWGQEEADGNVAAIYPLALAQGLELNAGDRLVWQSGGDQQRADEGFCWAGAFALAAGLQGPCEVHVLIDGQTVASLTLTPQVPSALVYWDEQHTGTIEFRMGTNARLGAGGYLYAEAAHLMAYRAQLHDLYLILRGSSARTNLVAGTDGSGLDETQAREIGQGYFERGCLQTIHGSGGLIAPAAEINSNAVIDAARRFSRHVRILGRQHLVGYAVEGGKSILWFRRYPYGLSRSVRADAFEGIADEIRHTAPAGGTTNQWVIDFSWKAYAETESSPFKASAYSDFWAFNDRCTWAPPTFPAPPAQASLHLAFGQKFWTVTENPTGYRYAAFASEGKRLNGSATADFYRSCRIYEPPVEIESAEAVTEDGEERVKVTLTGRLHHHHASAPASIDRDIGTWNLTNLRAESYRTHENAIREYLVNQSVGGACVDGGTMVGQAAVGSTVYADFAATNGTCYPHIMLVQLVPEPYRDENAVPGPSDTPLYHDWWPQMELYLRAMCEGYVDGRTSIQSGCTLGIDALYDYSFENLCFDAFGGRWMATLGITPTGQLPATEYRADAPEGHGPLPNTYAYAEVYNQFAAAWNQLTSVRVMLPFQFEGQTVSGAREILVTDFVDGDGVPQTCSTVPTVGVYRKSPPQDVTASTVVFPWAVTTGVSSAWAYGLKPSGSGVDCGGGGEWILQVTRSDEEYRWELVDPDAINALPPTISDMLQTHGQLLAEVGVTQTYGWGIDNVGISDAETCGAATPWQTSAGLGYLRFPVVAVSYSECRLMPNSGKLRAPVTDPAVLGAGGNGVGGACIITAGSQATLTPIETDAIALTIPFSDAPTD